MQIHRGGTITSFVRVLGGGMLLLLQSCVDMRIQHLKYGSLCGVALGREQILLLHHCLQVFGLASCCQSMMPIA